MNSTNYKRWQQTRCVLNVINAKVKAWEVKTLYVTWKETLVGPPLNGRRLKKNDF
jgi:hypothetical protein